MNDKLKIHTLFRCHIFGLLNKEYFATVHLESNGRYREERILIDHISHREELG